MSLKLQTNKVADGHKFKFKSDKMCPHCEVVVATQKVSLLQGCCCCCNTKSVLIATLLLLQNKKCPYCNVVVVVATHKVPLLQRRRCCCNFERRIIELK